MCSAQENSTNVSSAAAVVADAKGLGGNISKAGEKFVAAEIATQRRGRWLSDNLDAIESHNAWVEKNGLPLAKARSF
jgi:antitoxin CcdA